MSRNPTAFATALARPWRESAKDANGSIVGRGGDPAGNGIFTTESTKNAENFRRDPVAGGRANRLGKPGSESQYPMSNVQYPVSRASNGGRASSPPLRTCASAGNRLFGSGFAVGRCADPSDLRTKTLNHRTDPFVVPRQAGAVEPRESACAETKPFWSIRAPSADHGRETHHLRRDHDPELPDGPAVGGFDRGRSAMFGGDEHEG